MERRKQARRHEAERPAAVDPVALTLAIWLGVIAGVTGLVRLSEQPSGQEAAEARTAQDGTVSRPAAPILPFQAAGSPW